MTDDFFYRGVNKDELTNNNENSNNTDTADKETKPYDNIYSNSNNQPSQTGESAASDDEKEMCNTPTVV